MSISYTLPPLLIIVGFACGACGVANAQQAETPSAVISVTGTGEATAPPDMATISAGVITKAPTAKAALDENNATMTKILAVLKERGVAEKDVRTSNFSVSPIHSHLEEEPSEKEVIAYRVQNLVQARQRNLAALGETLDAIVQAGGNQISGVSFGVGDPSGILNEARSQAMRDAKDRAEVYAQAAGVKVGPVRQISEQPVDLPRPMELSRTYRVAAASVPIATGEQEYRVTVNVVYDLERTAGDADAER